MRRVKWGVLLLVAGAMLAPYHYEEAKSPAGGARSQGETASGIRVPLRVSGTIVALKSATLMAPRIAGSRSGRNRGGDSSSSRGGSDFNLVLVGLAEPGAAVKSGDVVAQFDSQSQKERLDDYNDSVVQQDNTIQSMMANLLALKEAHDQNVRQAKADWDKAVLDLKTAPVRSVIDAEKGRLAVDEAEAAYRELEKQSALVDESQRAQVRASELNRDQARLELERAEANVEKMTMRAPIDGLVVMVNIVRNGEYAQVREGDQINARQPFVSIVDPSAMALDAVVNQVDAERLSLGLKAIVRLDAYPEIELPGTIVGMGAMARPSSLRRSYVAEIPIRIRIDTSDNHLIPDLTGSAELELP